MYIYKIVIVKIIIFRVSDLPSESEQGKQMLTHTEIILLYNSLGGIWFLLFFILSDVRDVLF